MQPLFLGVVVRQICCYVDKSKAVWLGLACEKQSLGVIRLKCTMHKSIVFSSTVAHAQLALNEIFDYLSTLDVFYFNRPIKRQEHNGHVVELGSPANQILYFIIRQLQHMCQKLI